MEDKYTNKSQCSTWPIEKNAHDPNQEELADVLQPLTNFIDLFEIPDEEYDIAFDENNNVVDPGIKREGVTVIRRQTTKMASTDEEFEILFQRFFKNSGVKDEAFYVKRFLNKVIRREERYLEFLGANAYHIENQQDLVRLICLRKWALERKRQLIGFEGEAKAEELRIGNVVQRILDGSVQYLKILGVESDTVLVNDGWGGFTNRDPITGEVKEVEAKPRKSLLEYIEPVLLTPEILERAGFVKDAIDELEGYSKHGRLSIFLEPVQISDGSTEWHTYIQFNVGMPHIHLVTWPPEFFHELQNLYFALTGEELQFNP